MMATRPSVCTVVFIDLRSVMPIGCPLASKRGTASTVIASATTSCTTYPMGARSAPAMYHASMLAHSRIVSGRPRGTDHSRDVWTWGTCPDEARPPIPAREKAAEVSGQTLRRRRSPPPEAAPRENFAGGPEPLLNEERPDDGGEPGDARRD